MATNKTKPSKTKQDRYTAYKLKGNFLKNYKKKLERHLKKFPNDEVAQHALKSGTPTPRSAPKNKLGWVKGASGSLRKEQAASQAKLAKIVSKTTKLPITSKTTYKNVIVNPFYKLAVLKGTLPKFVEPSNKKDQQHSYKRLKTKK